jgi:hypothetical protein
MTLPDFLFIGPDKTGSTWLYELLRGHPGCFVPEVKDLYFFDRHFDRGTAWYASFFAEAGPAHRAVGEVCHDYLFSDEAADRIRATLPGVRLLTFLRDPVDRSFSQYLYLARAGRATGSWEEAAERYPRIVDNSRYARHLARYLERFAADRIGVFLFEDLRADPDGLAAQVLAFLDPGLPAADHPVPGRTLPAGRARLPVLARLAKAGAERARGLGLPGVVGRVKRSPVVQALLYRPFAGDRPEPDEEAARRIAAELAPDLEALPGLLGWPGLPKTWTTTHRFLA